MWEQYYQVITTLPMVTNTKGADQQSNEFLQKSRLLWKFIQGYKTPSNIVLYLPTAIYLPYIRLNSTQQKLNDFIQIAAGCIAVGQLKTIEIITEGKATCRLHRKSPLGYHQNSCCTAGVTTSHSAIVQASVGGSDPYWTGSRSYLKGWAALDPIKYISKLFQFPSEHIFE